MRTDEFILCRRWEIEDWRQQIRIGDGPACQIELCEDKQIKRGTKMKDQGAKMVNHGQRLSCRAKGSLGRANEVREGEGWEIGTGDCPVVLEVAWVGPERLEKDGDGRLSVGSRHSWGEREVGFCYFYNTGSAG